MKQAFQARLKTAGSTVEERRFQRRVSPPELTRALAPEVCKLSTGNWPLATGNCLYEPTMNSPLWKKFPHPCTKPVIVEDTTCGVSLLTDTISGSNFAIP
jgi:hypothetical protein